MKDRILSAIKVIFLLGLLGVAALVAFAFALTNYHYSAPEGIDRRAATATASAAQKTSPATATTAALNRGELLFGPVTGSIQQVQNGSYPEAKNRSTLDSGVVLKDFIAEATFFNPYSPREGVWDYGFVFRQVPAEREYYVYVDEHAKWSFGYAALKNDRFSQTEILSAPVENMDTRGNGWNTLRLVAQGENGEFFVNGELASGLRLSLSRFPGEGKILSGVALNLRFYNRVAGKPTRYENFGVWSVKK